MLPIYKKQKKKTDYKAKLDKEFSLYIRLRDAFPGGMTRCISCNQIKPFEKIDCGHFYSRSHLATRFDEDNCHGECSYCNRFKSDHLLGYRENLIKKIGQTRVDLLAFKKDQISKISDFEYKQLIKYYKILNEKLRKEKGI